MRDSWVASSHELRKRISDSSEMDVFNLSEGEVDDLVEFLHALTGAKVSGIGKIIPDRVPSGLPVVD